MAKRKPLLLTLIFSLLVLIATAAYAAVDLVRFEAEWSNAKVVVTWETASENTLAGFNIWRSTTDLPITNGQIDTSQATKVNTTPITNSTNCTASGHTYTFDDTTVVTTQHKYYYYLEGLNCQGGPTTFVGDGTSGLEVMRSILQLPFMRK